VSDRPWYAAGVRFGCTRSGACCHNHGEYSSVYFTQAEEARLVEFLGLSLGAVRRRYIRIENGYRVARSRAAACVFLDDCSCTIYPVRPVPCRTWPFWPDAMAGSEWEAAVKPLCRGVGQGRLHPRGQIEAAMRRKAAHDRELDEE
jgi:Fe-S-cluster containining protein